MSNRLDQDQARRFVGPDLGPNCLQRLSADDTTVGKELNNYVYIPDKKRNAPLRNVQLSGRSRVIGQFSLSQCKGMSGTAASHVFCNLASTLC